MASVSKRGSKFKVVHEITGVPVSPPNTFDTPGKARTRADEIKCNVLRKCR